MSVTYRMESERGRIGKEIKRGLDKNNKPWANFSLAVDVNARNDQGEWEKTGTNWYQVSLFGAQAKNVADSLRPGAPVVVSGDVTQRVRVAEGPDGAPVAQAREEVKASMVAPDMVLTPVVLPEPPASPWQAGPGASEQLAAGPASQVPGPAQTGTQTGRGPGTSQAVAEPGEAGSIWPPAVQPGSGQAGLR